MSFTPQFLDELRDRIDLAGVIGRHVKLIKRGREYVGLSPFKPEKTPSFTVVPEKGFYHDFASGEHGDIIDFLIKVEGLSFPEAVEKLAGEAGMEVPRDTPEEAERAKKRAGLFDVMELATQFFERQLRLPEGRKALEYLQGRGLTEETIKAFRLGYAPDHAQALKNDLARENVREEQMIEGGLRKRSEDGSRGFDYFRGRVMFPIADRRGRILGFGARIMGDGQPKYLNSPETPLFHKGRVLYGLNQASRPARDAGKLLVTEGYMDVIALAQAGFDYAVAPLGTALTEDQIKEAWKLAPEPVVCFDGDSAGAKAAMRAVERVLPLLKPGHALRFAALPEGDDPDSLIEKSGPAAMTGVIEQALPLSEVIWRHETAGKPINEPEARAALNQRLDDHVRRIGDAMVRKHFSQAFKDRLFQSAPARPSGGFGAGRGRKPSFMAGAVAATQGPATKMDAGLQDVRVLLAILLSHPGVFAEVEDDIGMMSFADPSLDGLRETMIGALASGEAAFPGPLLEHLTQLGYREVVDRVMKDDLVAMHRGRTLAPDAETEDILELWQESAERLRQADSGDQPPGPGATEDDWARYIARKQAELGDGVA